MHSLIIIHHNKNGEFFMDKKSYAKLVKDLTPKEPKLKNAFVSFIVGGILGVSCEMIATFIVNSFAISKTDAYIWTSLFIVLVTSILTSLGKFDNLVTKIKCGLIIPTTGFAHSITASALDYKRDGLVTGLGSNFFKLAGSVLLYGIISAFLFVSIEVLIYG